MTKSLLVRALLLVAAVLLSGVAEAGGSYTIKNKAPQEVDGRWKFVMTFNLGKAPTVPHVPMNFQFTMTSLYERACEDKTGAKAILNKRPLQNQTPINSGMDVGFSDGSGKTFAGTNFDFVLRRDNGFEAGEYQLKITRTDDGSTVGQPQTIILNGNNKAVDRRAMVFAGAGEQQKKCGGDEEKTEEKKDETPVKSDVAAHADPDDTEGPPAATGPAAGDGPAASGGEPPPVPPKQGGCGCRTAGAPVDDAAGLALLALGAALVARRRRAA